MAIIEKKTPLSYAEHRHEINAFSISSCDLIKIFNDEFADSHNTLLVGGASEPEYKPADHEHSANRIFFTRDYVSSALHEIAHWCVAGDARLKLLDYGYWYIPDGRNQAQQRLFETVEVKPQALEWIFSRACGVPFRISVDNLNGPEGAQGLSDTFKRNILHQARQYCLQGLHSRALRWTKRLQAFSGQGSPLIAEDYVLSLLENG